VCEALVNVIRQRREAIGLSLNRLADLTRLSRPMVRFIETNRRAPPEICDRYRILLDKKTVPFPI
jgi:transcriptional regulator with XRE-family HTH domain